MLAFCGGGNTRCVNGQVNILSPPYFHRETDLTARGFLFNLIFKILVRYLCASQSNIGGLKSKY
jgi:hypothetical protein